MRREMKVLLAWTKNQQEKVVYNDEATITQAQQILHRVDELEHKAEVVLERLQTL